MFLLLSVAVPMRVDIFLLERRSGLTKDASDGVNVLLEADRFSARKRAAGPGRSAKWLMA